MPLEVLGVCICLFFSLITAVYKHYNSIAAKKAAEEALAEKVNDDAAVKQDEEGNSDFKRIN